MPTDEILLSINQGKKTTINLYKTKLEQHVDGALKFIVECIVVTCPEGTEFLAAKEERPR